MYKIDKDKIFWRKVEGDTVILNIDTGFYYTLDEVGSEIWDMVLDNQNEEQILSHILDKYDIDEEVVKKDVKIIVKNLEKEKLIETK